MNLLEELKKLIRTDPITRDVLDYRGRELDEDELRSLIIRWYTEGFRDGRKTL